MKATLRSLMERRALRQNERRVSVPVSVARPVGDVHVRDTEDFVRLLRAVNLADGLGIGASLRAAAMTGMHVLADGDPQRMQEIISEAGACGAEPLRRAINELAAVGRAQR